jgi:hypothetical protein
VAGFAELVLNGFGQLSPMSDTNARKARRVLADLLLQALSLGHHETNVASRIPLVKAAVSFRIERLARPGHAGATVFAGEPAHGESVKQCH